MGRRRFRFGGLVYLLFVGVGLIGLGGWFALVEMGAPVPGLDRGWPALPIWGGLAFWLGWLLNRRAWGLVIPGTLLILHGLFFSLFSFGVLEWTAMDALWPVFPLMVGVTFGVAWVASFFRRAGLLVPAGILVAVGIVGLAITATPFGSVVGVVGWPVAIVASGAFLLLLAMLRALVKTLRLVAG